MTTIQHHTERVEYATANDVFAGLKNGGSVSVEEWPAGDLGPVAARVGGNPGTILVEVRNENKVWNDTDPGAPFDTVSVHPDECNRLALIDRAIEALQNAHAALLAVGYVDHVQRREAQA